MDIREQWEQTPFWQRMLLIVIGLLFFAFAVYNFLLSPKLEEYKNLNEEVSNLGNQIELLKNSVDAKKQKILEKKLEEIKEAIKQDEIKLQSLSNIIPPKPNIDDVLNIVSLTARKNMIILNFFKVDKEEEIYLYYNKDTDKLEEIKPKQYNTNNDKKIQIPENAIKLKRIVISTDMFGDMKSTKNFLDDVSKSERFIAVDNIVLKNEGSALRSTINLLVYYLPEDKNG